VEREASAEEFRRRSWIGEKKCEIGWQASVNLFLINMECLEGDM
jgi:hypothetical protein